MGERTYLAGAAHVRAGVAHQPGTNRDHQGKNQSPDASALREGDVLGIDSDRAESNGVGRNTRVESTLEEADHPYGHQYFGILQLLIEPYRTMVVVAQYLGLRVSEILALQWPDINFAELTMRVSRAAVDGIVDEVKTEYSEDDLPLDPDLATVLLNWKRQCPESEEHWVFPSPITARCYHASPIQQDYIRPAGRKLGLGDIGWHSFRHTYRSWLDSVGTPIGVQQKLMRHAQIATTMNVYGNAMMESKREANSKVVQMALKQELKGSKKEGGSFETEP